MPPRKARSRAPEHQRIPRIRPLEAEEILKRCDGLLAEPGNLAQNLQGEGFASLLRALDDKVLQLALQPDSWGERTRARVISAILDALGGSSVDTAIANVAEIAHRSSIIMPCLLLELGRRNQYIHITFPHNPVDPSSQFFFSTDRSGPVYAINNEQLLLLLGRVGEELVGLCYFGDAQSRARVETELQVGVTAPSQLKQ